MNNELVRRCARGLADRLEEFSEPEQFVVRAYWIALGRAPMGEELRDCVAFLELQQQRYAASRAKSPGHAGRVDLCQVLLCLNELVYVE